MGKGRIGSWRYVEGMTERITAREFHQAEGVEDWRALVYVNGACAYFRTGSFAVGVALIDVIGRLADAADHHPDVDLRYGGVTVSLSTHSVGGLSERDVALARQISAAARDLNVPADPSAVQQVNLTIDRLVAADVQPFWQAVLGYRDEGDEDLVDAYSRGPSIWFQEMDAPRFAAQPRARRYRRTARPGRGADRCGDRGRWPPGDRSSMRRPGGCWPTPKVTKPAYRPGSGVSEAVLGGTREPLVHNAGNAATGGIWRVTGTHGSSILKIARPPTPQPSTTSPWQTSNDPTHWNYWRREVLAYSSGLAADAYRDGGIAAPELIEMVEQSERLDRSCGWRMSPGSRPPPGRPSVSASSLANSVRRRRGGWIAYRISHGCRAIGCGSI